MTNGRTVEVWAIMWLIDDDWEPYKIFKKRDNKTLEHARKNRRALRNAHPNMRFKIERILVEDKNGTKETN